MGARPQITIVGLGPAGLERVAGYVQDLLADERWHVFVRTIEHPAASELAARREVRSCDDLYESAGNREEVYSAIADRVMGAAGSRPVIFAVPGSAAVGERSVDLIRRRAPGSGIDVEVVAGESFLDLLYARLGLDPITSGLQILDGTDLPDPLPFHLPTIITQVDRLAVLGDVAIALGAVLDDETSITVMDSLGSPNEAVVAVPLASLARIDPGPRTTLFLDPPPAGWYGLVATHRQLRAQCPWDREQTHHSLLSHLVEETYETVEALSLLGPEAPGGEPDFGVYAEIEEELGDLLLQVVFHSTLAAEAGAFGVEEVAEGIRRKLVRRHPHVFGDVDVTTPEQVITNWEHLKTEEKERASLMDDVPGALPAIARADKMQRRAASVGFDWESVEPVLAKVREEVDELETVLANPTEAAAELGNLLFAVVSLARHLDADPELALRLAADSFAARFRTIERLAVGEGLDLAGASLREMNRLWEVAKSGGTKGDDHRHG